MTPVAVTANAAAGLFGGGVERALPPRVVVVSRPSERDELLLRHGTLQQARFFLDSRGQRLDRFLFEPEDVIVAVGQDGLVANVAKYLRGQPVIGVNPSTALYAGVLVRH